MRSLLALLLIVAGVAAILHSSVNLGMSLMDVKETLEGYIPRLIYIAINIWLAVGIWAFIQRRYCN